jgi:type VI secretion system secreted protein Hcp
MPHPALRPVLLATLIALLPAGAALAGSGIYLDIPTISGGSTDSGHAGQIDVLAMSWGVSVAIGPRAGGVGKPSVSDLAWSQAIDQSVVPLFDAASGGRFATDGRMAFVKPQLPNQAPFLSLELQRAAVTSLSLGGGGGDSALNGSLAAQALTLRYDPGALGAAGPVLATQYNLLTNVATGPAASRPESRTGVAPARAGLYLRLGSGTTAIAGDSQASGYENWIAIDSFAMGASVSVGAGGQVASRPAVNELSWSQALDVSAPAVLFNLLQGQSIGQVTIEQVVLDRNGRPMTVMQQALDDVLFSSFNLSTDSADRVSLSGSMNFTSYSQTVWLALPDGSRSRPFSTGYDLVNARSIPGALAREVAGFGMGNLNPSAQPVPEPQTWALMLAGIGGLCLLGRRRA